MMKLAEDSTGSLQEDRKVFLHKERATSKCQFSMKLEGY